MPLGAMLMGDIYQVKVVLKLDSKNKFFHHISRVVCNTDLQEKYILHSEFLEQNGIEHQYAWYEHDE